MTVERLSNPDVAIPATAEVGEGPVWDPRTGRLCWVDVTQGKLFQTDLATGESDVASIDTMIGAIAPRASEPGFAVAVSDGLGFFNDGTLDVTDPVLPEPYRRMNDAKCDSRGRLWAGSTHMEFEPGVGMLHRWDGTGPSTQVATGFTLPNGLGWTADDTTMYFIDSMANVLLSSKYHADEGEVEGFDGVAEVEGGLPDGLAVDTDGCVWLAVFGASEVRRYSPTGDLIGVVELPVAQPTSCLFGDDGTLYITTARYTLDDEQLASQPHAGAVFAITTSTSGVPVQPFAG